MRIFVTDRSTANPADLRAKLIKPGAAGAATLARLKQLNPQVDFDRLAEGTVLLLPDSADVAEGAGQGASGDTLANLGQDLDRAIDLSTSRIKQGLERATAEQRAVGASLKLAAVAAQIKADPTLQKQIEATTERAKADAKRGAESLKALADAHAQARDELAALAKLFG
jgi:hypothetical protein